MAVLESELGVGFNLKKKAGGVTTDQGRTAFLEHADRIAADCDVAVGKMQELSADGGKIDIGYIFPLAGHYIPHKVREFLDKEENKNVVLISGRIIHRQSLRKCVLENWISDLGVI